MRLFPSRSGLGSTSLIVPERDVADTVITAAVNGTDYVVKNEIKALINSLDILGITDITAFAGAINLTNFYSDSNQDTLLLSASMHATISDQILDLGSDKLIVPAKDVAEENIRVTNSVDIEFVQKAEIKALIEALEVLEVTDITSFTGAVTLSHFFESANPPLILTIKISCWLRLRCMRRSLINCWIWRKRLDCPRYRRLQ